MILTRDLNLFSLDMESLELKEVMTLSLSLDKMKSYDKIVRFAEYQS